MLRKFAKPGDKFVIGNVSYTIIRTFNNRNGLYLKVKVITPLERFVTTYNLNSFIIPLLAGAKVFDRNGNSLNG